MDLQYKSNTKFKLYFTILFILGLILLLLSLIFIAAINVSTIIISQKAIYYIYILENKYVNIQLSNIYKFYTKLFSKYLLEKNIAASQIFNLDYFDEQNLSAQPRLETTLPYNNSVDDNENSQEDDINTKNRSVVTNETTNKEKLLATGEKKAFEKFKTQNYCRFLLNLNFTFLILVAIIMVGLLSGFFSMQTQIVRTSTDIGKLIKDVTSFIESLFKVNTSVQELVYDTYDDTKFLYEIYAYSRLQSMESFYQFLNANSKRNIIWFSNYYSHIEGKLTANYTEIYMPGNFLYLSSRSLNNLTEKGLKTLFTSSLSLSDYFLILNNRNTTTIDYIKDIDNVRFDILSIIEIETNDIIDKIKTTSKSVNRIFTLFIIVTIISFIVIVAILFYVKFILMIKQIRKRLFICRNIVNLVPYKYAKTSNNIKVFMAAVSMKEFSDN